MLALNKKRGAKKDGKNGRGWRKREKRRDEIAVKKKSWKLFDIASSIYFAILKYTQFGNKRFIAR